MAEMGTYGDLLSSSASFARLLEDINQHQQEQIQEQKQQATTRIRTLSKTSFINEENGDEVEMESVIENIETKQEGTVKWDVYVSYLQAGIGVILGILSILTVFSVHQVLHMYSNQWLAEWSDEESQRFRADNNCTNVLTKKIERIRSMTQSEWNEHRIERFYWFSSKVIHYI